MEIVPETNNGRDHKIMQTLDSDEGKNNKYRNGIIPEVNNGRDHKTSQSQNPEKQNKKSDKLNISESSEVKISVDSGKIKTVVKTISTEENNDRDNKIMQSLRSNKEISQKKETKLKEKSNKNPNKKTLKSMRELQKLKPEKTTEQKITIAGLEIAKQIKNGTKLSKEQASEILELMKNNKVDISTTPNNTENISENREKEIMEKLEKGFRKQKNTDDDADPDIHLEESY